MQTYSFCLPVNETVERLILKHLHSAAGFGLGPTVLGGWCCHLPVSLSIRSARDCRNYSDSLFFFTFQLHSIQFVSTSCWENGTCRDRWTTCCLDNRLPSDTGHIMGDVTVVCLRRFVGQVLLGASCSHYSSSPCTLQTSPATLATVISRNSQPWWVCYRQVQMTWSTSQSLCVKKKKKPVVWNQENRQDGDWLLEGSHSLSHW